MTTNGSGRGKREIEPPDTEEGLTCCLCGEMERLFNFFTCRHQAAKPPEGTRKIICSSCVQKLLAATQEKLQKAYQLALDKKFQDKADAIEFFFKEEQEYVPEARKPGTRVARKRTLRSVKSANKRKERS